jgi:DNA-directed RNA polymerase specialized sigma24 family protein
MASPSETWTLHRAAFETLIQRLSGGGRPGAEEYETIRRKLVAFLDLRGAVAPETAADATLDRVARRIEEGETIQNVRSYVFGVARLVLLETARRDRREQLAHEGWSRRGGAEPSAEHERRLACLDRCLGRLTPRSRQLVHAYHAAVRDGAHDGRAELARRLDLSPGALRTRAHRIRNELAVCLDRCLGESGGDK